MQILKSGCEVFNCILWKQLSDFIPIMGFTNFGFVAGILQHDILGKPKRNPNEKFGLCVTLFILK